jgi:hypothetical protein
MILHVMWRLLGYPTDQAFQLGLTKYERGYDGLDGFDVVKLLQAF